MVAATQPINAKPCQSVTGNAIWELKMWGHTTRSLICSASLEAQGIHLSVWPNKIPIKTASQMTLCYQHISCEIRAGAEVRRQKTKVTGGGKEGDIRHKLWSQSQWDLVTIIHFRHCFQINWSGCGRVHFGCMCILYSLDSSIIGSNQWMCRAIYGWEIGDDELWRWRAWYYILHLALAWIHCWADRYRQNPTWDISISTQFIISLVEIR